jgi:hypothetical protein
LGRFEAAPGQSTESQVKTCLLLKPQHFDGYEWGHNHSLAIYQLIIMTNIATIVVVWIVGPRDVVNLFVLQRPIVSGMGSLLIDAW